MPVPVDEMSYPNGRKARDHQEIHVCMLGTRKRCSWISQGLPNVFGLFYWWTVCGCYSKPLPENQVQVVEEYNPIFLLHDGLYLWKCRWFCTLGCMSILMAQQSWSLAACTGYMAIPWKVTQVHMSKGVVLCCNASLSQHRGTFFRGQQGLRKEPGAERGNKVSNSKVTNPPAKQNHLEIHLFFQFPAKKEWVDMGPDRTVLPCAQCVWFPLPPVSENMVLRPVILFTGCKLSKTPLQASGAYCAHKDRYWSHGAPVSSGLHRNVNAKSHGKCP